jgi:hypothetical protein
MKILLSAGIQLAQADISVDQAQDLGLISYLSFLKIKAAQQLAQLQKGNNDPTDQTEAVSYYKLLGLIDEFLHELKSEIEETNSIDVFLRISKSLENNTKLDVKNSWVFDSLLQRIHVEAKEVLVDPRKCFMNTIAAIQSLSALSTFKSKLTSEAFCPKNSKDDILMLLNKLQTKTFVLKNSAATWQVA